MASLDQIQISEIDPRGIIDKIREFENLFIELKQSLDTLTKIAHSLADELDVHHKNVSIANVTGSAAGIVGGIIGITGFVLSFFTFGAASPLIIVGAVVAGAGGGTVGGATITRKVLSQTTKKKFEQHLQEHSTIQQNILERCKDVSNDMEQLGEIDEMFPQWVQFWRSLVCDTDQNAQAVVWKDVIVSIGFGLGGVGGAGKFVAKVVGKNVLTGICAVGRGLHIAGGVVGILFIPFDIYTLVDNAIDIHKKSPNDVATLLRDKVSEIARACPTKRQVHAMITNVTAALKYMKCVCG